MSNKLDTKDKSLRDYFSMIFNYRLFYAKVIKKHFPHKCIIFFPFLKPLQVGFPMTLFIGEQPFLAILGVLAVIFFPWVIALGAAAYIMLVSFKIFIKNVTNITPAEAFFIAHIRVLQKIISEAGKIYGSIKYRVVCL